MPPALKTKIDEARIEPAPDPPPGSERIFRSIGAQNSTAAGVGSEIEISFSPFSWTSRRIEWTSRITDFAWNRYFYDEQIRGPFAAFRHRHGTSAEYLDGRSGTMVIDDIEYQLPYGPLGRLVDGLVYRQLERWFEERQNRLPGLLRVDGTMSKVFSSE